MDKMDAETAERKRTDLIVLNAGSRRELDALRDAGKQYIVRLIDLAVDAEVDIDEAMIFAAEIYRTEKLLMMDAVLKGVRNHAEGGEEDKDIAKTLEHRVCQAVVAVVDSHAVINRRFLDAWSEKPGKGLLESALDEGPMEVSPTKWGEKLADKVSANLKKALEE